MKKLVMALALAGIFGFASQVLAGHCVCTANAGGGSTVKCCEEPSAPDPNAPPENLCGAIVVPGAASISGCISDATGVSGCLEGEPDGTGSGHVCLDTGTEPPSDPTSLLQAGPGTNNTDTDACDACGCLVDTGTAC